jgi:hypothetical protein
MNRFIGRQILDPVSKYLVHFVIIKLNSRICMNIFLVLVVFLPYGFFKYKTPVIMNGIRGILKRDLSHIEVWVPTLFQLTGLPISCKSVSCREFGCKFYCPLLVKIKYVYISLCLST